MIAQKHYAMLQTQYSKQIEELIKNANEKKKREEDQMVVSGNPLAGIEEAVETEGQ